MPSAGYTNQECFHHGVKYASLSDMPGELRSVEIDVRACQKRCEVTINCAYFSFWSDGGCYLQSSNATAINTDVSVVAGPRRCENGNEHTLYQTFES